jgi:hypothetical protein
MHGDVWLAPYCRGLQALFELPPGAHVGSRAKADGRPRTVPRGSIAGVCLAMIVCMAVTFRPGMARAQPGTEDVLEIPVHPKVATIMHLPDAILRARVNPGSSMRVTLIGRTLHVRPDPEVPTGLEALLEVETPTMLLTFRLHVVESPEDAREELVVVAMKSEQRAEVGPIGGSTVSLGSSRFDFSVHASMGLAGITAVKLPGYAPGEGRRSHHTVGLRLGVTPHGGRWGVEAGVSAEWAAPTIHIRDIEGDMVHLEREVSGPWLQADAVIRMRAGTRWMPTAYAGGGLQMQLRHIKDTKVVMDIREPSVAVEDMPIGAVLTVGMGLQRQVGDALLGIDLQLRQGVPGDYRSVGAFLFVAFVLDQGD